MDKSSDREWFLNAMVIGVEGFTQPFRGKSELHLSFSNLILKLHSWDGEHGIVSCVEDMY